MANLNGHEAGNGGYSQGEPIGTAPVLDPTDEEGRETRDGPFGEWTPTRKGGNSGAPPALYTTALALHSTER